MVTRWFPNGCSSKQENVKDDLKQGFSEAGIQSTPVLQIVYLLTLAAPLVQHLEHQFYCNQSSQVWLEGGAISVSQSLSGRAGFDRVSLPVPTTHGPRSEGGWAPGPDVQRTFSSLALAHASSSTRSVSPCSLSFSLSPSLPVSSALHCLSLYCMGSKI